jgi:hypothetical protein
MNILPILSRPPFDGTDAAWNALRFAHAVRRQDVRFGRVGRLGGQSRDVSREYSPRDPAEAYRTP